MNKEKEHCREKLKEIIDKKELYFTKRCNKSIDLAIVLALNKLDKNKERFLFIQEEGGWMTYKNYAKKFKLTLVYLKMSNGKISESEIKNAETISEGNGIILIHSLPGYSYNENMKNVHKNKGKNILINDCCGSIGTDDAKFGDIIVCSFGDAKPLSAGGGGFISSENFSLFNAGDSNHTYEKILLNKEKEAEEKINFKALEYSIKILKEKVSFLKNKAEEVKKELKKEGFEVINQDNGGINVLVSFSDEEEKERLINYCKEQSIEYTECPRYIRTNKKALSLEIKRIIY